MKKQKYVPDGTLRCEYDDYKTSACVVKRFDDGRTFRIEQCGFVVTTKR